ncbi:MAG: hypothetical protein ACRDQI_15280, partial [Pseudonocardiaceae bacterium]
RHPLELLPFPVSRLTGQPQQPNGQIVNQTTSSNGFDNADQSPVPYSKVNRFTQPSPGAAAAGSREVEVTTPGVRKDEQRTGAYRVDPSSS